MSNRWHGDLVRHPASPPGPVERITVTIERTAAAVTISYELTGDIAEIVFPEPALPERRDALWTATCFELFARANGNEAYFEWNFAPSTAWAAYAFDGYRANMRNANMPLPAITTHGHRTTVIADLSPLPADMPWHIGLSAVIRHADGGTSYWAIAHPPGPPDFHNADCFAVELV